MHFIDLNAKNMEFNFQLLSEPVAFQLDPFNDVFRRLGADEVPASLGQIYGSQTVMALLPQNGNIDYQEFAQSVAKPEMIFTSERNIPEGSIWVFGREHSLKKSFIKQLQKSGVLVSKKGIKIEGKSFLWENNSFVFTLPRAGHKEGTMTWVIAGNAESISGLIRKLPHYGKYGYLVFEGTTPENLDKGAWPSNPVDMQKVFKGGHPRLLPKQETLVSFLPFPE
jgi:aminopeptidase N